MSQALVKVAKQNGWELLPDNATHTNRVQIRSESSNRLYTVAFNKNSKEWACSCPGWIVKRAGRDRSCKHLQAMLPMLQKVTERKRLK